MNKRINPKTAYPMSTDKQIKQAEDLLYLSNPHFSDDEIIANIENPSLSDKIKLLKSLKS